jgi:membrane protease YdiL (CAAX protease family)
LFAAIFAGFSVAQSVGLGFVLGWRMASGHQPVALPGNLRLLMFDGAILAAATLTSLPAVIGLTGLFAWLKRPMRVRDYLGLRWPALREFVVWIGALALFTVGEATAGWVATRFFGRPEVSQFMRSAFLSAHDNPLLWFAVLVGAPVGEELMFRGFLFAGLAASKAGPVWAAVISSVLWAGIHLQYDLFDITEIFVLGLLLSAVWWKTRSLFLCMLLHSLVGLLASAEMFWLFSHGGLDR